MSGRWDNKIIISSPEKSTRLLEKISPLDFDTKYDFLDSGFQNSEHEVIARNIVIMQQRYDWEDKSIGWKTFTSEQYFDFQAEAGRPGGITDILIELENIHRMSSEGYFEHSEDESGVYFAATSKFVEAIIKFVK